MSKVNVWFSLMFITTFLIAVIIFSPLLDVLSIRASEVGGNESEELAGLVPDIRDIYEEALITPLEEAGMEINDPEIKAFYNKLLANTGLKGK